MPANTDPPVYLILGATGGIGRALTARLAARGARLVLAARTADDVHALAAEHEATPRPLDATDFDAVSDAVQATLDAHGRLDGAVNLAGSILLKPGHLTSVEEFEEVLRQNLHTAFHLVKAAAKAMYGSGGALVLVSSVAARYGLPNHEAVAAAKAGVAGLTRAAAASYAPRGIRVNAVAPGLVRTPMSARLTASAAAEEASAAMHPLGRIGEPDDVARAIDFLLDEEQGGWITGQVLSVDGGFATVKPR